MPVTPIAMTIPADASMSNAAELASGTTGLFLFMPDDWTNANLTFQFSLDGVTYADCFGVGGIEITMVVTPGAVRSIEAEAITFPKDAGYLKLRSGSRDFPVKQEADRVFTLSLIS